MAQTKLSNLVNPEVMKDMINASLPAKIKFAPIADVDKTLVGIAGDTITVPKYEYIGDAEDVAEGVAMGTTVLTTSTTKATVKKAGKAVEITDESVLSGYGDPIGQATNQLGMSIAAKVDNDCVTALGKATLTFDGISKKINYAGIVDAVDKFNEEEVDIKKLIFIHPNQLTTLRKDPDFLDKNKYPLEVIMNGVIGSIAGCQVVVSRKVPENKEKTGYENYIVKCGGGKDDPHALSIYLKKEVEVEGARDILKNTNIISADEHYTAVLSNEAKVVKAIFKK